MWRRSSKKRSAKASEVRLRYLDSARADIRAITWYITRESGSSEVAARFVERLRERCRVLARLPGTLGRPRPELHPDLRSLAVGNYVIFFRYGNTTVDIVNILEGHRDIDAFFRDHGP
jgi:toxin ParE1/3/4